ncbi:ribonuclease H-like domain-containing protein [Tanacetum coccineum]
MKKMYCLVVTDDFSRFSWVFFLATKDETSEILKTFIIGIENLIDLRAKVIRCDNGTEFKNRVMNQFCEMKGIKREFSVARTSQQNGVAERKNRTLIEAARTMLADSKLPITFWAEAVNTACKFDGKADEGFFVGYSTNSKAFREFNSRTRIVEENLHVQFSENTPNITGSGPNWLFDIDAITKSMNYKPVVVGNQSNGNADTKACDDADPPFSSSLKDSPDAGFKPSGEEEKKDEQDANVNSTNNINTVSQTINAAGIKDNVVDENIVYGCDDDPNIPYLEKISRFSDAENDDSGADINNLDTYFQVSSIPTTRIHKDHPLNLVIGDLQSATQKRQVTKNLEEYGFVKPKKVVQALKDPSWIEAMQEELLQFKLQEVWTLVELPNGKRAIGTKWVFRNKKDERGIVIKNKARLVAQEDQSKTVTSRLKEKSIVCQPQGFEDPYYPVRVLLKVEKALNGLASSSQSTACHSDKQVGDMSTHDKKFVTPSHTKKVFSNMKRVGKGFSGVVIPLFPTMMVQSQEEMGEESRSWKGKGKSQKPSDEKIIKMGRFAQVVSSEDEVWMFLMEKKCLVAEQSEKGCEEVLVKESSKKAKEEMAQESSSKRIGEELEQKVAKKQKMEDDKEKEIML